MIMDTEIPIEGMKLTKKLNGEFTSFFHTALKVSQSVKGYWSAFIRHIWWQKRAARKRAYEESRGIHVPPFLIYSVTQKCNLMCKGCYARHLHGNTTGEELSLEKSRSLIKEAQELGVSVIMLAGGEPLTKEGLLNVTSEFPRIVFPLFTNGLLVTPEIAIEMRKERNLFPIISIEGEENTTDARRGAGVHAHIRKTFDILSENGVLFGVSITVTSKNFDDVTGESFVMALKEQGARIIFYIEYIPCADNHADLVPSQEQRSMLKEKLEIMRRCSGLLFISFPGDEENYGGCLAAGRGFVHIGSSGRVEPCPFSPYSDSSLSDMSLRDALKSRFLKAIRENHGKLSEHQGGCALWETENGWKKH